MRAEPLSGLLRNERRHVLDQQLIANPHISPLLIHYVEVFATEHAGTHCEPHVTEYRRIRPGMDLTWSATFLGRSEYFLDHRQLVIREWLRSRRRLEQARKRLVRPRI